MQAFDAAYNPAQWSTFLSAEVSASAALTGLLFVAVSINLSRILANAHLPARVGKALVTLFAVLLAASVCLIPGQPRGVLGAELTTLGVVTWLLASYLEYAGIHGNSFASKLKKRFDWVITQVASIPLVVCGISVVCGLGGGLYWLVPVVVLSFVVALLDAWVLLIEIQR